jgi:hypothetical protein
MSPRPSKSIKKSSVPTRVYQLLLTLQDVRPLVWRRLLVPESLTLAKLDRVIQSAMGWTNSHLHEFRIGGLCYGVPDPDWDDEVPILSDRRFRLGQVLEDGVSEFIYLYDFGDGWTHRVVVERVLPFDPEMTGWPMCLGGANSCPPEDVGGTSGYEEFLQAIRDVDHPEHPDMWRWNGGPFDPTSFDMNAVNQAIRGLR